jgi:hypothetical protein
MNNQKLENMCSYWHNLSRNPNAIYLLEKNQDKIYWDMLSQNPNAISLLEKNPDKIVWIYLSSNPNAIHILEKWKGWCVE